MFLARRTEPGGHVRRRGRHILVIHYGLPHARHAFLGNGIHPLHLPQETRNPRGHRGPCSVVRQIFVGDQEEVGPIVFEAVHPVGHEGLVAGGLDGDAVAGVVAVLEPVLVGAAGGVVGEVVEVLCNVV